MTANAVQMKLLRDLYQAWREHGSNVLFPLREWAIEQGVKWDALHEDFEPLVAAGLTRRVTMGAVSISPHGILTLENQKIVSPEQVSEDVEARFQILDALAKLRKEHGSRAIIDYTQAVQEAGLEELTFLRNEDVLQHLGLTEWITARTVGITFPGIERVEEWRTEREQVQQFADLKSRADKTPQARGHDFERLLEKLITAEGWAAETNVHAPGEEHDLIIHRQLEYYLVECKWLKETIQPHHLSVLRDRVTARMGMRGLYFSMSGFTPETVKETLVRLERAMILLFGPQDIETLMSRNRTFSDMLQDKFHAAITKRAMLVDGESRFRS